MSFWKKTHELQQLVNEVKERSLVKGLKMNVKKTKTMVIRRNIEEDCKIYTVCPITFASQVAFFHKKKLKIQKFSLTT